MLEKICTTCKEPKPATPEYFASKKSTKDGLQHICRVCKSVANKEHYSQNKEKYLEKARRNDAKFKQWYREYKASLVCSRCGEDHPACIEFHHTDPSNKISNIADLARQKGRAALLKELVKCIPLCANCHAKEHWRD